MSEDFGESVETELSAIFRTFAHDLMLLSTRIFTSIAVRVILGKKYYTIKRKNI